MMLLFELFVILYEGAVIALRFINFNFISTFSKIAIAVVSTFLHGRHLDLLPTYNVLYNCIVTGHLHYCYKFLLSTSGCSNY